MTDPKPSKRPPRRRPGRLARRVKNAGILPSTVMVLLALLAGAVTIWIGFTRLLRDAWPWQQGGLETNTPGFQLMQLVLTLIGGIGAAILVVVAYRRQRDLETARFDDRFAAAAAQLGADTAAERLAGVYAMAALADTWEQHRQQCINVLCAYLRLPYDPGAGLLAEVVSEHTWPVGGVDKDGRGSTGKETRIYRSLPNDREVRHTIVRVITEHLRDAAATSWQGRHFDFTGAVFDGGDFTGAHFTGGMVLFRNAVFVGQVSFDRATFSGGQVSFREATFAGDHVWFEEATFSGGLVWFDGATFASGLVSFDGATFATGQVWFDGARFSGGQVWFDGARFSGGQVSFDRARFSDGQVSFDRARFSDGQVSFDNATFSGDQVSFDEVEFSGCWVSFIWATFAGRVSFDDATFSGGHVWFSEARFSGGQVWFSEARFSGGQVSFDGARFSGGQVWFNGATFATGQVSFDGARFSGGQVWFDGATFATGQVSFDETTFADDATVRMPPHDPAAGGWPTKSGQPFYGWPPTQADAKPSNKPPTGPERT